MFSTSLAAAAFGGLLAAGSVPAQPAWQTDYRKALVQAADQQKPIAVLIGKGGDGYAKVAVPGGDAAKLLQRSYVCLYVDAGSPEGKELAGAFQMTEGLVISTRAGTQQALRHEGAVTPAEMTKYVTEFAGTGKTVAQTEYVGTVQPAVQSYYTQPRPVFNAVRNVGNIVLRGG